MINILCIDNSGSTEGSAVYWDKVYKIYKEFQPYRLIYWNNNAKLKKTFEKYSGGCTEPECFIKILQKVTKTYNLIITTDGEISDESIAACGKLVTTQLLSLINSTVIYYIGSEENMNIGLNVIFGRTKQMPYHINEKSFVLLHTVYDNLDLDAFLSPNFAISLIVHIKNIELEFPDIETRKIKLAKLRGDVCRLYSRLEHETLNWNVEKQLDTYFQNNQMKEFVDILRKDRLDIQDVSKQKNVILNLFDSEIDFNISRISAATTIYEEVLKLPAEEEISAWSEFEDIITVEKFNLPCLLVQNADVPWIAFDKVILKHPFKLLSEPDIINNIMRIFEPTPIDYTTYLQLVFDDNGYTISPYTRAKCKGVFVLDAVDMKSVNNNCRALSPLFGNEDKVPGNLVLWNLVVLYLLHKYKFNDSPYKDAIFNQIIEYCVTFSTSLSFTHQCQILRRARIEVCLWYCIYAAPTICPNTAKNVLRSPFGLELVEFYMDTIGRDNNEYLKKLSIRTRMWAVWNYFLANKGKSNLKLVVKAQYQNYCMHKGHIIFRPGKCEIPLKSKCNILDADIVNTLFVNLADNSTKVDDIDYFKLVLVNIDYTDSDGVEEDVTHVKINIKTCWPFVICPVTNLHWRECIGKYDVKKDSHIRLFNTYCTKYKIYPTDHMDLAMIYSRKNEGCVVKNSFIKNFEYIFKLFEEVMTTYTCEEYLSIYTEHTNEKVRLSQE